MTRTLLALSAGLLCVGIGVRRSHAALKRQRRLHRWTSLMHHLALLLNEEAGSLPQVLHAAACEQDEPDRILREISRALCCTPLLSPDALPLPESLPPDEAEALRRCLRRLTQGSRESRVQAAEHCEAFFSQLFENTRAKSDADAAMWRQLGLLGGACLTLWLM